MKKVQIEFDELPFPALERFGLTREMIEDLDVYKRQDKTKPGLTGNEAGETL